jgi:hypothetical protein
MQPSKVMPEKDALMSGDMAYFHMALHAMAEMEPEDAKCFNDYYCYQPGAKIQVKVLAHRRGISRETFYTRKLRFAHKALSLAGSLKRIQEEPRGIVSLVD